MLPVDIQKESRSFSDLCSCADLTVDLTDTAIALQFPADNDLSVLRLDADFFKFFHRTGILDFKNKLRLGKICPLTDHLTGCLFTKCHPHRANQD